MNTENPQYFYYQIIKQGLTTLSVIVIVLILSGMNEAHIKGAVLKGADDKVSAACALHMAYGGNRFSRTPGTVCLMHATKTQE